MLQLRAFGVVDLRDPAGSGPALLLAQPKRLALLLVLVLAGPGRYVRRDRLLALFWPELDTLRARHALRQALYVLRAALGKDAILSRGDEEVGIAAGSLWCDVHTFEALLAAERRVEALDLYAGDLLPSFYVSDVSSEFEHWLDAERSRLRSAAAAAAWSLSDACDAEGNALHAVHWARRAVGILRDDEAAIRRLLLLLDRSGDGLGALQVYGALERRLRQEYDLAPSPETRDLVVRFQEDREVPGDRARVRAEARPGDAVTAGPPRPTPSPVVPRRRVGFMAAAILLPAVLGVGAALAAHRAAARVDRDPATSAWNGEARVGTTSTVARRLYEEGQRAHYRGDARGAYRLFAAALAEDSTFALAAYYAGVNRRRFDPGESAEHPSAITLVQRGVRLAERAPERDRLTIELEQARAERARYAAIAESLAARFPAEPIGHLALAGVRFAAGDFLSAAAHARRALAADSMGQPAVCHSCDALEIIINAYVYADSLTAAERVARDLMRRRPGTAHGWNQLLLVLARQGRRTEAMAAYRHAEALEPSAVDGWTPVRVALLADDYAGADEFISLRQRLAGTTSGSQWWQVISLRNQGRHAEALATAGQLSRVDPTSGRLSEAQVLFEMGHYRDAARRFEALARAAPGSAEDDPGMRARHVSWMLTHAATAWHASGDTLRLRALADTVESIAHLSAYGRDWRLPSHIRGLLSRSRGDDRQAAAEFRAALFSPGEGFTRTNLELARTLLSLGNADEAVSVLQPALRGSVDGANFYVTRTELHELLARAFDLGGRADSALAHRKLAARARTAGRIDLRRGAAEAL